MKRTQIQLPDWLFMAAGEIAKEKEISLAELVRRGLEYMVSITPDAVRSRGRWKMPSPSALGGGDPFENPDWREHIHTRNLMVAEEREEYMVKDSN